MVSIALFAIFRSHFSASVPDLLVWGAIFVSGLALILFFAALHQAEGILCTAPIYPGATEVLLVDPRFATPLCVAHSADWMPVPAQTDIAALDTSFATALYYSTVAFTTLGYGDFQPVPRLRALAGIEAVIGYAYLGMVIGLLIDLGNRR